MIKKITEDYCSYEVAKLLKEKGFEIDTNRDYWKIGEDNIMYFMSSIGAYSSNPNDIYAIYRPENSYPCPTLQMAMKWLREVHKINIEIHYNRFGENYKYIIIYKPIVLDDIRSLGVYFHYEEAVEAAIKYSLENII